MHKNKYLAKDVRYDLDRNVVIAELPNIEIHIPSELIPKARNMCYGTSNNSVQGQQEQINGLFANTTVSIPVQNKHYTPENQKLAEAANDLVQRNRQREKFAALQANLTEFLIYYSDKLSDSDKAEIRATLTKLSKEF